MPPVRSPRVVAGGRTSPLPFGRRNSLCGRAALHPFLRRWASGPFRVWSLHARYVGTTFLAVSPGACAPEFLQETTQHEALGGRVTYLLNTPPSEVAVLPSPLVSWGGELEVEAFSSIVYLNLSKQVP